MTITRMIAGILAACLIATAGCLSLEKCAEVTGFGHEPVSSVVIVFEPYISVADDTVTPGGQIPGLVGQIWLFSQDRKKLVAARGNIEADLFDMTSPTAGQLPKQLADWKLHRNDLKQLQREDKIGLGYTVFLPWEKYDPSIKKVQLRLTYIDERGVRHTASPATLNLRGLKEAIPVHFNEKNVPAIDLTPQKKAV